MAAEHSLLGAYEVIRPIGKGSFGKVSRIRRIADGKTLVWKEMEYGEMKPREKQMLVSEVNILRELRHPNIVRYFDRIIDRDAQKIYIVMEYCESGDLASYITNIKREKAFIEEDFIWRVLSQVVSGLYVCHERAEGTILHRDIKPGNIFLDADRNVKLGDFGLARVLGNESVFAYTFVGTPYYMSPEQVNNQAYNEKSDVWSLGCVIYEMGALTPPFNAVDFKSLAVKVQAGKYRRLPTLYSEDLNTVIRAMLQVDPSRRPSVRRLLDYPQIQIRVRERKIATHYAVIKKQEAELSAQAAGLKAREQAAAEREANAIVRERELLERFYNEMRQQLRAAGVTADAVPAFATIVASVTSVVATAAPVALMAAPTSASAPASAPAPLPAPSRIVGLDENPYEPKAYEARAERVERMPFRDAGNYLA